MPEAAPRQFRKGTAFIEKGGGEALLLIHGVGLNAEAWLPQIEAFSDTHRVIALDMLGHGGSNTPPKHATLQDYIAQAVALLDELGIERANVIGHSMGGLVAIGTALEHASRVLRLGVLNSVYERSPEARAAVEQRAAEIALNGSCGDIELPVRRWLGVAETPVHQKVRAWLSGMNPLAYASAYSIFATGDRLFSGRLGALAMPALFATGEMDPNSIPAMAEAMAAAAQRGKVAILGGQRHMMNLVDPAATNRAIRTFLAEPLEPFDPRGLRNAFGSFMTGVTVVTTIDETGNPRGFTANSFTSVSLDPPLLLVCIGKTAASHVTFSKAPAFAINILSEHQKDISSVFASKRPDKFAHVRWHSSRSGNPLIDGAVSWFDCARHEVIDAGDHIIVLGAIRAFESRDANPLGYSRGGYVTLGLEQAAVNAAAGSRTIVGAILECDGKLVMERDEATGMLRLPEVGRAAASGTASLLQEELRRKGVDVQLGFLFAVFENPDSRIQCIYDRGDATLSGSRYVLVPFEALAEERLPDEALRIMLRRYVSEREEGRFKIYSGDHERGEVRTLG